MGYPSRRVPRSDYTYGIGAPAQHGKTLAQTFANGVQAGAINVNSDKSNPYKGKSKSDKSVETPLIPAEPVKEQVDLGDGVKATVRPADKPATPAPVADVSQSPDTDDAPVVKDAATAQSDGKAWKHGDTMTIAEFAALGDDHRPRAQYANKWITNAVSQSEGKYTAIDTMDRVYAVANAADIVTVNFTNWIVSSDAPSAPLGNDAAKSELDEWFPRDEPTTITIANLLAIQPAKDRPETWYDGERVTFVQQDRNGDVYTVKTIYDSVYEHLGHQVELSLVAPAVEKPRPPMWHENPDNLAHWWDSVKKLAAELGVPSADVKREVATALMVDDPTMLRKGKGVDAYNSVAAHFRAVYGKERAETPVEPPPSAPASNSAKEAESTPQKPAEVAKPAREQPEVGNPFMPAKLAGSYLRLALSGPSGSGKTYTALQIATNMKTNARVAVVCTERGSARMYANLFTFDVLELQDYAPSTFINAVKSAVRFKYDVLIIDSLTHEWNGTGGILSIVDGSNDKFGAWAKATPLHQNVINTILDAPIHIICTLRAKTSYEREDVVTNNVKKTVIRKLGMQPIQRDDLEYEFDVFASMDTDNTLTIEKSRIFHIKAGTPYQREGKKLAADFGRWITEVEAAGAA